MTKLTLIFLAFVYITIEIPFILYKALVSFFTYTQKDADKAGKVMAIAMYASPFGLIMLLPMWLIKRFVP